MSAELGPFSTTWWRDERPRTLPEIGSAQAARSPDRVLLDRPAGRGWEPVTASMLASDVTRLALGLMNAGIRIGDRVAVLARRGDERSIVLAAIWTCGAVAVPIAPQATPAEAAHILADSRAVACIVDGPELAPLLPTAVEAPPALVHRWSIEPTRGFNRLAVLRRAVSDADLPELTARGRTLGPDSLALVRYTFAPGAPPDRQAVTHGLAIAAGIHVIDALPALTGPGGAAALIERSDIEAATELEVALMLAGIRAAYADADDLPAALTKRRPTLLVASAARFASLLESIGRSVAERAAEGDYAVHLDTAIRQGQHDDGSAPDPFHAMRFAVYERLVYREIREAFGGRIRHGIVVGAPPAELLAAAFRGIGLPLVHYVGLTNAPAGSPSR